MEKCRRAGDIHDHPHTDEAFTITSGVRGSFPSFFFNTSETSIVGLGGGVRVRKDTTDKITRNQDYTRLGIEVDYS